MESCRRSLVGAIKSGCTFALYLGAVTIEHADFKKKLCTKNVFPSETFQQAGLKLKSPDYDPKYKAIFREEDLEQGEAVCRDGFRCIVISSHTPFDYEKKLEDSIPLGYLFPIYIRKP